MLEGKVKDCHECQANRKSPASAPLHRGPCWTVSRQAVSGGGGCAFQVVGSCTCPQHNVGDDTHHTSFDIILQHTDYPKCG